MVTPNQIEVRALQVAQDGKTPLYTFYPWKHLLTSQKFHVSPG